MTFSSDLKKVAQSLGLQSKEWSITIFGSSKVIDTIIDQATLFSQRGGSLCARYGIQCVASDPYHFKRGCRTCALLELLNDQAHEKGFGENRENGESFTNALKDYDSSANDSDGKCTTMSNDPDQKNTASCDSGRKRIVVSFQSASSANDCGGECLIVLDDAAIARKTQVIENGG